MSETENQWLKRRVVELSEMVSAQNSAQGKMAGTIGAIKKHLDSADVPLGSTLPKRVKLLTVLYKQSLLENQRLSIMLDAALEKEMGPSEAVEVLYGGTESEED